MVLRVAARWRYSRLVRHPGDPTGAKYSIPFPRCAREHVAYSYLTLHIYIVRNNNTSPSLRQGTRNDNCGVGPKAAAVDRGPGPSHIENPVSWLDRNRLAAFTSLLTSPRALMVESRVSVVTKAASRTAAVFCHRPPSGARDAKRACRAYVAPRQRVD
ncbi:hypothetical protein GW17_00038604 [Ensete ventricosum]|nr:hypothetical protein GW17_00038604 [Ensete ventricosum]